MNDLQPLLAFLGGRTPESWCEAASNNIPTLLIDHAHCEKKAAASAMSLIYRYPNYPDLLARMSRLAREELRHFEQVLVLMHARGIAFENIAPARYAEGLRQLARTHEPARLVDVLIIGAFIEARSCERFAAVIPYVDEELAQFYQTLLKSEARHFQHYIQFAEQLADGPIADRIDCFRARELELITSPDPDFRFHSGVPGA